MNCNQNNDKSKIRLEQMNTGRNARQIGWECSEVYHGAETCGLFVGVHRPVLSSVARKKMNLEAGRARMKV